METIKEDNGETAPTCDDPACHDGVCVMADLPAIVAPYWCNRVTDRDRRARDQAMQYGGTVQ